MADAEVEISEMSSLDKAKGALKMFGQLDPENPGDVKQGTDLLCIAGIQADIATAEALQTIVQAIDSLKSELTYLLKPREWTGGPR